MSMCLLCNNIPLPQIHLQRAFIRGMEISFYSAAPFYLQLLFYITKWDVGNDLRLLPAASIKELWCS